MKKLYLILSLGLITIIYNSCNLFNPEIHCKDFDKKILEWMPYAQNDTLNFIDSLNHTYKLFVNKIYLIHQSSYRKRTDCGGCYNNWGLELSNNSDSSKKEFTYHGYDQDNPDQDYFIKTNNINLNLHYSETKIEYLDNMVIKGQTFINVKVIRYLADNDIKVILARNLGFIMIKFGDLELYNVKFLPVFDISLKSYNYLEENCN